MATNNGNTTPPSRGLTAPGSLRFVARGVMRAAAGPGTGKGTVDPGAQLAANAIRRIFASAKASSRSPARQSVNNTQSQQAVSNVSRQAGQALSQAQQSQLASAPTNLKRIPNIPITRLTAPAINTGNEQIDYEVTRFVTQVGSQVIDLAQAAQKAMKVVQSNMLSLDARTRNLVKRVDQSLANEKTIADQMGILFKEIDELQKQKVQQDKKVKKTSASDARDRLKKEIDDKNKKLNALRDRAKSMQRDSKGRFIKGGLKQVASEEAGGGIISRILQYAPEILGGAAIVGGGAYLAYKYREYQQQRNSDIGVELKGGKVLDSQTGEEVSAAELAKRTKEWNKAHPEQSSSVTPQTLNRMEQNLRKKKLGVPTLKELGEQADAGGPLGQDLNGEPVAAQKSTSSPTSPQQQTPSTLTPDATPANTVGSIQLDVSVKSKGDISFKADRAVTLDGETVTIKGTRLIIDADVVEYRGSAKRLSSSSPTNMDQKRAQLEGRASPVNPVDAPGEENFGPSGTLAPSAGQPSISIPGGNSVPFGPLSGGFGAPRRRGASTPTGSYQGQAPQLPEQVRQKTAELIQKAARGEASLPSAAVDNALSLLGAHELDPNGRQAIVQYLKNGGRGLDPARTAWCAAYVNSSLAQAGIRGTGSNVATSFMNWGAPVGDLSKVTKGDVLVQSRGHRAGETGGHVLMATGQTRMVGGRLQIEAVAGNDSNRVNRRWINAGSEGLVARRADASVLPQEVGGSVQTTTLQPSAQQRGAVPQQSNAVYDKIFKGTALEGHYDKVVAAAQKNGIDPSLMAAVMAHETGRGSNLRGNNVAGLMDPRTGMMKKQQFASIDDGISAAARTIAKNYRRAGGDIDKLGQIYAPVGAANDPRGQNSGWARGVSHYMNQLGTKGGYANPNMPAQVAQLEGRTLRPDEQAQIEASKRAEAKPEAKPVDQEEKPSYFSLANTDAVMGGVGAASKPEVDKSISEAKPVDRTTQPDLAAASTVDPWNPDAVMGGQSAVALPEVEVTASASPPAPSTDRSESKKAERSEVSKNASITDPTHDIEAQGPTPGSDGYGSGVSDPDGCALCST